jgi:hypothetical protein
VVSWGVRSRAERGLIPFFHHTRAVSRRTDNPILRVGKSRALGQFRGEKFFPKPSSKLSQIFFRCDFREVSPYFGKISLRVL